MTPTDEIAGPSSRQTMPWGRAFLVLVALLIGFVLLKLPFAIWPVEVHSDEHYYAVAADRMMASGNYIVPETITGQIRLKKPPLAYYYIVAGVSIFGQSVWATKVFWLASAVAALALTYRMTRLLGAGVTGAAVAVAFLGGHRVFFRSATQHIPDMPLVLGTTVGLLAFVALLSGKGGRFRPLLYMFAYGGIAFAVLAKGVLAPALLLPYFVARFAGRGNRPSHAGEWKIELAAALTAMVAAGWWFLLVWHAEPDAFVAEFFGDQVTGKVRLTWISVIENLRKLTTDILGSGLPILLTLLVGRRLGAWKTDRWRDPPVLMLILWIATVLAIFSFGSVLYERYILPALPAVAALVGLVASSIRADHLKMRLLTGARIFLAVSALAGVSSGLLLILASHPLNGLVTILVAAGSYLVFYRSARNLPAWSLAGLLGAAYPLVFIAFLPVHFIMGVPTRDAFAAKAVSESGVPGDRVWIIGARKLGGRVTVLTGGAAEWTYARNVRNLPENGPLLVLAEDPALRAPLEEMGLSVVSYQEFSLENLDGGEILKALRNGDIEQAGRQDGKRVIIGIRN